MATPDEVNRDCNTCRKHTQASKDLPGRLAAFQRIDCELCLCNLALHGELSHWQPEIDPTNNIEA